MILISTPEGEVELTPEEAEDFLASLPLETSPSTYRIGKSTPWRRMTDAEAATVSAAMKQQTIKNQMIYDAASYIDTSDELFGTLEALLKSLFGESRMKELLAPES